ncbi:hypothetical protein GCM10010240_25830 [Streptomyces griseoviridis]|nr:hypothetical protein GCM10010240_25830 [Streptomyces griseoviridis]
MDEDDRRPRRITQLGDAQLDLTAPHTANPRTLEARPIGTAGTADPVGPIDPADPASPLRTTSPAGHIRHVSSVRHPPVLPSAAESPSC